VTESINLNDEDAQFFSLFDDYTDSVELLFDLIGSEWDRLPALENDRDFVLSLGAEEVVATIGADGIITFDNPEHLKALTSNDLLTLRLYLNGDAGNVLWEQMIGLKGISVTSSVDSGSSDARSFIYCPDGYAAVQGLMLCNMQDPIQAELVEDLDRFDRVRWVVEAREGPSAEDTLPSSGANGSNSANKKVMYGKSKSHKIGALAPSVPEAGTGNGQFNDAWKSGENRADTSMYLSFEIDMDEEVHSPITYTKGSPGGTLKKDVRRRNPYVAHDIRVYINGVEKYATEVKMDELDVLRQEYMSLIYVIRNDVETAYSKGVRVPTRSDFIALNELPTGNWVDSNYPYRYVVDGGMVEMAQGLVTALANGRSATYVGIDGEDVSMPEAAIYNITSSYRNPERNERVKGASASRHMLGKAVDLGIGGIDRGLLPHDMAAAYYAAWKLLVNGAVPKADMYQVEDAPAQKLISRFYGDETTGVYWNSIDLNDDGVWDILRTGTHIHMQDEP
jgi:hypothetical protein